MNTIKKESQKIEMKNRQMIRLMHASDGLKKTIFNLGLFNLSKDQQVNADDVDEIGEAYLKDQIKDRLKALIKEIEML